MIFIIKKRLIFIILIFLGIGLLCSGFLNIPGKILKEENTEVVNEKLITPVAKTRQAPGEKNDFFIEYRLERERTRGQQIQLLREIINSSASSSQAQQQAQQRLLELTNRLAREVEIEHLIRANGFKDATVCIEEKGVTAIIRAKELSLDDRAKICELISWGTGVGEQNIIIIPKG